MKKNYIFMAVVSTLGVVLISFYACVTKDGVKESDSYDVIVIGSGPAGCTAGVYASRAKCSTLIVAGEKPGGLLVGNPYVENWPGEKEINGSVLMKKMQDHAKHCGCSIVYDVVTKVDFSVYPYKIFTGNKRTYKAKSVIIAMGVKRRKLGCPGEDEYWYKGVSACATCHAPLFRGSRVVVVGGGSTALTEAHHLSHFAKEVIVVHRRDKFRTSDPIKDVALKNENLTVRYNNVVKEIKGNGSQVTEVVLKNTLDNSETVLPIDGVFVSIGFDPNTKILEGQIELGENKYIKTYQGTKTSKEGISAAGDIIHQDYQQAIVAAGDGCKAALECINYLDTMAAA